MRTHAKKSSSNSAPVAMQAARQSFIARAGGGGFFAPARPVAGSPVQTKMTVNKPGDKFEQEADGMADKVMRMPTPSASAEGQKLQRQPEDNLQKAPAEEQKLQRREEAEQEEKILRAAAPEEKVQKAEDDKLQKADAPEEKVQKAEDDKLQKADAPEEKVQRKSGAAAPAVSGEVHSGIRGKLTGGQPLSADVRGHMEPRFNADFRTVRIHTDPESASLNNRLGARAFTYQNHIFFSRDQYQPGSSEGKHLLAHELTHTIQQGHSVQRSPQISTATTPPAVQRWGIQDALDHFADWAYNIPGFRLLTIFLGFNPINMRSTDRNAANLLRALIELMPGGAFITQALDNHGVINKAASWVEQKIKILGDIGSDLAGSLRRFLDSLSWRDIFHLGDVWDRAKRIFTEPISRLIAFARSVVTDLLKLVKDAILRPLAALAQGTRGYDLLCTILGRDPITNEPVPRNAETLLGGFMKLIGQEEIWQNIQKGHAVARAYAWFQAALSGLMGFVLAVPRRIIDTLTSLTFQDIITVAGAFRKVVGAFLNIAGEFISWGMSTIWNLLEIIFDVVKPGLMRYIKRTGAALKSILKNPLPFLGHLIGAAKLGFNNFSAHFGAHLKAGLIDWLTGSLPGVYIPKAFSLIEFGKFALSVLGITWTQIRGKIVKALGPKGEMIMQGLETAFDIVVALVKGGPIAAWDLIKDKLSDLKDTLISGIVEFVTETIIAKAIPKLIAMFIPGAGFISAIISIYDTIMVFVHKIAKIIQVVTAFINSIVAIAAGHIVAAANRVEGALAGLLTLAISFLAGFLGLGNIADKIRGVIEKVRATVDKALDTAIGWIVGKAKALFKGLFSGKQDDRTPEQKKADLAKAMAEATALQSAPDATEKSIRKGLGPIKSKYRMTSLELVIDSQDKTEETVHVAGQINPPGETAKTKVSATDGLTELKLVRPKWIENAKFNVYIEVKKKHEATPVGTGQVRGAPKGVFDKRGRFKVGRKWARRHILSSYDMKYHYEHALILPHKTYKTAGAVLRTDPKRDSIKSAAQARLAKFHNDVNNLWIGDTRENSRLQENVDASPEMYDKTGEMRVEKLQEHIQKMCNEYAIPGDVPLTVSDKHGVLVDYTKDYTVA